MSTTTLQRSATAETDAPAIAPFTIYGDFNCPWSYLAFRRAQVLATGGVAVDWRAVEHLPRLPRGRASGPPDALRDEMEEVLSKLPADGELSCELPGFLPRTAPAVAAYAEGYVAGVAAPVAGVLFESFWMRKIDVGNVDVLRTLLVDELLDSASPSLAIREWGTPVALTGAPMSTAACHLVRDWSHHWQEIGEGVVPMVLPSGEEPLRGVAAAEWLEHRITELGLGRSLPSPATPRRWRGELPPLGWASIDGGRWHRRFQRCGTHGSAVA